MTADAGAAAQIREARTSLGIELGSTRIKACLVGEDPSVVLAVGEFEWENQLVDGRWSYALDDVWAGLAAAYAALASDVETRYGVRPTTFGAIGVSGAPGGEADEACANAGIKAIADSIEF